MSHNSVSVHRLDGSLNVLAKLPSAVTKIEFIKGRLFANTALHGRFEILEGGALIPVASASTSKAVH